MISVSSARPPKPKVRRNSIRPCPKCLQEENTPAASPETAAGSIAASPHRSPAEAHSFHKRRREHPRKSRILPAIAGCPGEAPAASHQKVNSQKTPATV